MDGLSGYPSRRILLGMLTALRGTWPFFVCVIRVYPVTQPSSDIFLDGYPPVKALDTTRITQCPSLSVNVMYLCSKGSNFIVDEIFPRFPAIITKIICSN